MQLSETARKLLEETVERNGHKWMSDFAKDHLAGGEARAVLLLLGVRGIPVSDDVRDRINGCTDIDQLDRWLKRAAAAKTAEELFL
ncbi:hypothetical protein AGRA3207_004341 [Actinomadura graeca]|uniref:DUF4332 domain-containing protein n=1 Tax=Actinomadura graeca TaxID=2750812 RepID=A0ABX8QZR6_9ACTN|nr:hypothetical protein [Actinomadura graeca]QXJ23212.1 hypothetical protein AGRA3207_004341 [Actinomadura graeca]